MAVIRDLIRPLPREVWRSILQRRGGGWTPATLFAAGEQGAWYDPSDFSTMFQDSAGTTPVTAVGQPVGKILDKSGRGNHATQATTANRPTLQQDGSGYYYLSFNGTNSSLTSPSVNLTAVNKVTVWAGATMTSSGGTVMSFAPPFGTSNFVLYAGAAAANKFSAGSAGTTFQYAHGNALTPPASEVLCGQSDVSAPQVLLRENGAQTTVNTTSQGTGNYGTGVFSIGVDGGTLFLLNGRVYQLIVRAATSTASQVSSGEKFVGGRMGIAL